MDDESRIFWHDRSPTPESIPPNDHTFIGEIPQPPVKAPGLSLKAQFIKHFARIREWVQAHSRRPGVSMMAMTDEAVRAAAFVATRSDLVATAILGRHSKADLHLVGDETLSLRHVALIAFPSEAAGRSQRYRLVDLRSATAFVDERGKRLRAIEADGPAFVHVGRFGLVIFGTHPSDEPWPNDARAGWDAIPDRLYLDEVETEAKPLQWDMDSDRAWEVDDLPAISAVEAFPATPAADAPSARSADDAPSRPAAPTIVHRVSGPQMVVHELVGRDDSPCGELLVTSPRGAATVVVGRDALQAGILLGRSRRCDAGRVLSDRKISRVHLLIIEIAGVLYAMDTASSNGVFGDAHRERARRLESGTSLSLSDVAKVEWRTTPAARA